MLITIIQFVFIFFIISISAVLATIEVKLNFSLNLKKTILFVLILIISITAAIRTIGTDTQNYVKIFQGLPQISNLSISKLFEMTQEPGFVLIGSFFKTIGIGVQGLFFVFSFVPLIIITSLIFKIDSKNSFLLFFIFISIFILRGPLDIIRQFFTMSLLLNAFYELSLNHNIKYYLNGILSVLFHYSSSILIIIKGILLQSRVRLINYFILLILSFVFGIIGKSFLLTYLPNFGANSPIIRKIIGYLSTNYQYDNLIHAISRILLEHYLPLLSIGLIIYLIINPYILGLKKINLISFNAMIIGSILYSFCIGLGDSTIAVRLNYMLLIGSFILIKDILVINPSKTKYAIWIFTIASYNLIVLNYYSNAFKLFY